MHDEMHALLGQSQRNRLADAMRGPRYQRDFAL
jgi:hypothetical protein